MFAKVLLAAMTWLRQARPLELRGRVEEGLAEGVRKMSAVGLEILFPVSVAFSR